MLTARQVAFLLCALWASLAVVVARPDSGGHVPLPGPGLSYGGIPYGSVSGNVAEYFRQQAPRGRNENLNVDFTPIEQFL